MGMTQLMRKLPIVFRLILKGSQTDSLMSPPNTYNSLFCRIFQLRYECEVSVRPARAQV